MESPKSEVGMPIAELGSQIPIAIGTEVGMPIAVLGSRKKLRLEMRLSLTVNKKAAQYAGGFSYQNIKN